ncbi:hypothetical protein ACLOAU_14230 [Niabella sp. CJ426]|uniref:hypothetical protein n=1 Tax=Niabella sp. CJ426 TaxID=3393740 RepID=UPI003D041FBA
MKGSFIIALVLLQLGAFSQAAVKQDIGKRDQLLYLLDSLHAHRCGNSSAYTEGLLNGASKTFFDSLKKSSSLIQQAGFEFVQKVIDIYGWPDPLTLSFKSYNSFVSFLLGTDLSTRRKLYNQLAHSLVKVNAYGYAAILEESLEHKPICNGRGWGTVAQSVESHTIDNSLSPKSQQANRLSNIPFSKLETTNYKF